MTQVTCGVFVYLAFNFDCVGLSPSGPFQMSSALSEHWGSNDIALQFLVIGSSIKEVGYSILYHFNLSAEVFSDLAPDVIHKNSRVFVILQHPWTWPRPSAFLLQDFFCGFSVIEALRRDKKVLQAFGLTCPCSLLLYNCFLHQKGYQLSTVRAVWIALWWEKEQKRKRK